MKPIHLTLAFALTVCSAMAEGEASRKKGICLAGKGGDEQRIEALNVGWHYSWTPYWNGKEIKGVPFVPMIFGDKGSSLSALDSLRVDEPEGAANPLLGYNEPDGKDQANMSVQAALDLWPRLEKTNRRLGSPVTVHADNEWMKAFMAGAGEKGHRVDFICVHWYGGDDADQFSRKLKEIHDLYKKPIWVTEFAVADWSAESRKDNKYDERDVLRFMKSALRELERLDFVERYAWFHAAPGNPKLGPSALFDEEGKLTKLGEFYAGFGK